MNDEKIKLLNQIGMKWYRTDEVYKKSLKMEINDKNREAKNIEINNKFKNLLSGFSSTIPSQKEINELFLEDFDQPSKTK